MMSRSFTQSLFGCPHPTRRQSASPVRSRKEPENEPFTVECGIFAMTWTGIIAVLLGAIYFIMVCDPWSLGVFAGIQLGAAYLITVCVPFDVTTQESPRSAKPVDATKGIETGSLHFSRASGARCLGH